MIIITIQSLLFFVCCTLITFRLKKKKDQKNCFVMELREGEKEREREGEMERNKREKEIERE